MAGLDVGQHTETIHGSSLVECGLWERDTENCLISIDYDPAIHLRQNATVNSRAALFWGMSQADLVHRLMTYDVPLPFSELDWLRTVVVGTECHFQDVTVHYLRMIIATDPEIRAMLICQTTIKTFNPVGRISQVPDILPRFAQSSHPDCPFQVKLVIRLVSPYEYNEAARSSPLSCRL